MAVHPPKPETDPVATPAVASEATRAEAAEAAEAASRAAGDSAQASALADHAALKSGVHGLPASPADGQAIVWDEATSSWRPQPVVSESQVGEAGGVAAFDDTSQPGTVDTVTHRVLVNPTTDDQNGVVVKAPTDTWGTGIYGTGQAFMVLKHSSSPTDIGHTGVTPDDLVVMRVDRRGGIGCSGLHVACGLRQEAGFTPVASSIWVENFVDCVGLVVQASSDAPTSSYQIWETLSGSHVVEIDHTGKLLANRQLQVLSGSAGTSAFIALGRAAAESEIAVNNGSNPAFSGTVAGDVEMFTTTGKIRIGGGIGTSAAIAVGNNTLGFHGAAPVAKATISGSRGGNAALASLLTTLATKGLITDGTTA